MNFFNIFDKIYVLHLDRCIDRKVHIENEFKRVSINNYTFFKAIDKEDQRVFNIMNSNLVHKYPPCFRCRKNNCNCNNKSITTNQIANWLSFMEIWKDIINNNYEYVLIFEDDVKFVNNWNTILKQMYKKIMTIKKNNKNRPSLIRLGWAYCKDHLKTHSVKFKKGIIKMSNPCHIINNKMAKLLYNSLEKINTTSDVYIHRDIPLKKKVNEFTIIPPLCYELSYNSYVKKFKSEIRDK